VPRILFLLLLVPTVSLPTRADAPRGEAQRPNIIVIMSDDMGYSDLGCYGSEINTPSLDKLAAGGLRYTQFYNTGRCCPTRASLLTGLYPHQAGVGHMTEDKGLDGYRGQLNDSSVTMAQVLKSAGYGTYAIGKWHVVNNRNVKPDGDKRAWPLQKGFDRFYGTITGAGDFYDPGTLTRDNTMISPMADPHYKPKQYYYTDAITDHVIDFMTEHGKKTPDKPMFMYVTYTSAHWPMHALPEDIAKYKGRYDAGYTAIREARLKRMKELGLIDERWETSPQFGDWSKVENKAWEARCMEVYAAMIDRMDQGIGRIVETLRQQGKLDNTLIFFMQDNGGCQETVGRQPDGPGLKNFPVIADDAIRLDVHPKQLRDGRPVRHGPDVMPGPADTYIAYGEGWANVSNVPFRLYKHFNHEGGISTPLIAHWPRGIARKGEWEKQPGHLIDIMATCVDVAGATYPKESNGHAIKPMEGTSLKPTFAGEKLGRDTIYWEHEGNRAIRVGDYKLVARGLQGKWELYDLSSDRTEMHDLSAKMPEKAKELADKWEAYALRANVKPYPQETPAGPARRNQQTSFKLNAADDLSGGKAPDIAGRAFTVTVTINKPATDGVLVAQGGAAHGFALYLKSGHLVFATRHKNKLAEVRSPQALPQRPMTVGATLADDGVVTLMVDGKPIATDKTQGPISKTPVDGLQVGWDAAGAVGDYQGPNAFKGEISEATLRF